MLSIIHRDFLRHLNIIRENWQFPEEYLRERKEEERKEEREKTEVIKIKLQEEEIKKRREEIKKIEQIYNSLDPLQQEEIKIETENRLPDFWKVQLNKERIKGKTSKMLGVVLEEKRNNKRVDEFRKDLRKGVFEMKNDNLYEFKCPLCGEPVSVEVFSPSQGRVTGYCQSCHKETDIKLRDFVEMKNDNLTEKQLPTWLLYLKKLLKWGLTCLVIVILMVIWMLITRWDIDIFESWLR